MTTLLSMIAIVLIASFIGFIYTAKTLWDGFQGRRDTLKSQNRRMTLTDDPSL